jgi:hypothetical protein
MKTIQKILFIITFFPATLFSQETDLESVKFVRPILERWIAEYRKENLDSPLKDTDLHIVANAVAEDGRDGKIVYVGRYALIPVSNARNPLLEKAGKGLKKKDLIDLVFEKDILDEDYDPEEKSKYTATLYCRGNASPTTLALAGHFDRVFNSIKGKKIFGDEIYLLNAIQKDPGGIAFNTINYVYDLQSRRLKNNISLLPLNLKSKQREALESGNVDRLIALLEESRIESIPVESFGLQIPEGHPESGEVINFIAWILEKGLSFNHEYGFLQPDKDTSVAFQKSHLSNSKNRELYSNN